MTTLSLPAASMRAIASWSSSASGVVLRSSLGMSSSPMRNATVPISPGRRPAARSTCMARKPVVVLPSVPVTPITSRLWLGRPNHASAASASARRVRSTISCGTATPVSSRSVTTAVAPRWTASGTKSWPSTWTPGTAKKTLPGPTSRES